MDDLRKFARYFLPYKVSLITGILCILVDVNDQGSISGSIETDGGAEHFGLAHPIRRHFALRRDDGPDISMTLIEHAGGWPGEGGEGNESGENSGR